MYPLISSSKNLRSPLILRPERPSPSPPRHLSSVCLVSFPPYYVHSQPPTCYSLAGPTRTTDGRPWPVLFETQTRGWVSKEEERRSNTLANRESHPNHNRKLSCWLDQVLVSRRVLFSRGLQNYDQGCYIGGAESLQGTRGRRNRAGQCFQFTCAVALENSNGRLDCHIPCCGFSEVRPLRKSVRGR